MDLLDNAAEIDFPLRPGAYFWTQLNFVNGQVCAPLRIFTTTMSYASPRGYRIETWSLPAQYYYPLFTDKET